MIIEVFDLRFGSRTSPREQRSWKWNSEWIYHPNTYKLNGTFGKSRAINLKQWWFEVYRARFSGLPVNFRGVWVVNSLQNWVCTDLHGLCSGPEVIWLILVILYEFLGFRGHLRLFGELCRFDVWIHAISCILVIKWFAVWSRAAFGNIPKSSLLLDVSIPKSDLLLELVFAFSWLGFKSGLKHQIGEHTWNEHVFQWPSRLRGQG